MIGRVPNEPSGSPSNRRRELSPTAVLAVFILALMLAACSGAEYPGSTIDTVTTDLGDHVSGLYRMVFWWTMFILALVWALLAYVIIRFRQRPAGPEPVKTRGNLALEVGWTLGPALIVMAITVPTIRTVFRTQTAIPEDALEVQVIGHQWWWEYRYPEQGVVTANELHLPVDRPVMLRMHSADVIHSFWVPRLGGKRDVNPLVRQPEGRESPVNRLNFTIGEPGVYHGQCAEFCGVSHGLMGTRVIAHSEDEFATWVTQMKAPPTEPDSASLAARGREVFMSSVCIACHTIEGTNARGALGPNLTRVGARTSIGAGLLENTQQNLARWISAPSNFKPGVKMPGSESPGGGMAATGLSDEQVEAVAAYLASLR